MQQRENYLNNPLWQILVDTAHSIVMYPHHKAYIHDTVLVEEPNITPENLALKLDISLGETLVILHELQTTIKPPELTKP